MKNRQVRSHQTKRLGARRLLAAVCYFLPLILAAAPTALTSTPPAVPAERPRLIVLTDYFKDPDDKQSMIRLLVYANEFELEGLIATSLAFGDGAVRPELIHEIIDDYAKVYPNLRQHGRPGAEFPAPAALKLLVKAGTPVVRTRGGGRQGFAIPYPPGGHDSRACTPAENWIGAGKDTAASHHIIQDPFLSGMMATALPEHEHAAHAHQVAIYRAMTPAQRIGVALRMNASMRRLLALGFQDRHPDWSEAQVRRAVADRILYARTG